MRPNLPRVPTGHWSPPWSRVPVAQQLNTYHQTHASAAELPPSACPSMGGRLLPTGCPSMAKRIEGATQFHKHVAPFVASLLCRSAVRGGQGRQTDMWLRAAARPTPNVGRRSPCGPGRMTGSACTGAYEILRSRVDILHAGWAWKAELTLQADHQDAGTRRRSPYSDEEVDALIGRLPPVDACQEPRRQGPDRPRRRPRRPLGREDLCLTGTTSGHRSRPRTGASFASTLWRRWRNP